MSVENAEAGAGVLSEYAASAAARGGFDELVRPDAPRPDTDRLLSAIDALGPAGLLTARADVRRLVAEDGITYGAAPDGAQGRLWSIDPIPLLIDGPAWSALEAGLQQRAVLLRLLLDDLYGDMSLLRRRIIAPEMVLGHAGFIRAAHGIASRLRPLVITATDLGRGADGSWHVINDRTQAPSGAGYVMATRRVVAKVLPRLRRSTGLAQLGAFFHTMTAAVQAAAPATGDVPRGVVLTPGAGSETAYDQAFTASLLGFPLVEADDLVMREGKVWLRTNERYEQVDVILRRVDESWSDPLDLRGDSQLGVPGLIEATRQGQVSVANPIGAGALENPALLSVLPQVSRALLGEDPLLPAAPTWWCGDPASRSHVIVNLRRLLIKNTSRATGHRGIPGWELTAERSAELVARIEQSPWEWVGQEQLAMSTAPVVTRSGLQARTFVLRTFGVHLGDSYHVMPGGLGRVAAHGTQVSVSNYAGALSKDVWVVGSEHSRTAFRHEDGGRVAVHSGDHDSALTPRVADNLYWFGRYAERSESTTRLLLIADDLAQDHSSRPGTPGAAAMQVMLDAAGVLTQAQPRAEGVPPVEHLRGLMTDADRPGTLSSLVRRLVQAAQHIRELASGDTWSVLASLERTLADTAPDDDRLQPLLTRVLEPLLALAGIASNGMVRDATWAFVDAGLRVERAQRTADLIARTLGSELAPVIEGLVTDAVLRVGDSIITHRRRTAMGTGPADGLESVLELLVQDAQNPRSLRFQLDRLIADLELIGGGTTIPDAVATLRDRVKAMDAAELSEQPAELASFVGTLSTELRSVNDAIEQAYFVRQARRRALLPSWSTPWQVV